MNQAAPRWVHWAPRVILGTFTALWLARWPTFPLLIDPYYHLLIARQIVDAHGPIAYEWWEYAPVGRPHLYPPLLHLLLAGLLALGCPSLVAIRLLSVLIPLGLLLGVYLAARQLMGRSIAFATLLAALAPFSWLLQVAEALASGIASLEILGLLVSLQRRAWVSAAGCLALLCYTHLGTPWVALAAVGWCWILGGIDRSRNVFLSVGIGLLLSLPWLFHVISHAHLLQVASRYENNNIELLLVLYLFALIGAWRCWLAKGSPRILLGLWAGFCLMARAFTFRWLSGEGLLPIILLAGYGLEWCAQRLTRSWRRTTARWLGILILSAVLFASPTLLINPSGLRWLWPDTTMFHLLNAPRVQRKSMDVQLYTPRTVQLAQTVASLSRPGEIVWSNATYTGGLVAVFAHRPTSSAMLYEVPPARPFDPIAAAHIVVWFKLGSMPGVPPLEELIHRYHLQRVAESDVALIFRNPAAQGLAHPPQAAISWWLAFVLSCGLIGLTRKGWSWRK